MITAIADTHAAIWYLFRDARLADGARSFIDDARQQGKKVGVSAISLAELVYLQEKDRVSRDTLPTLLARLRDPEVVLQEVPVNGPIAERMQDISRNSVPDLPDRVIAATALHFGVPVISRDRKIQASGIETVW